MLPACLHLVLHLCAAPEGGDPSDGPVCGQEGEPLAPHALLLEIVKSARNVRIMGAQLGRREHHPPVPSLLQAVIVKNFDDGDKNTDRSYGHALVVGLAKEPRKVRCRAAAGWDWPQGCWRQHPCRLLAAPDTAAAVGLTRYRGGVSRCAGDQEVVQEDAGAAVQHEGVYCVPAEALP